MAPLVALRLLHLSMHKLDIFQSLQQELSESSSGLAEDSLLLEERQLKDNSLSPS